MCQSSATMLLNLFTENRRERRSSHSGTQRDRRATRSSERSHAYLSGVSVQVEKEESIISLKDSVLNGSSVSVDENTALLH